MSGFDDAKGGDRWLLRVGTLVVLGIGAVCTLSATVDFWATLIAGSLVGLVVLGAVIHSVWQLVMIEWELHRPIHESEIYIVDPPQAAQRAADELAARRAREEKEKQP